MSAVTQFLNSATEFFNALNPLLTALQPLGLVLLTGASTLGAWWAKRAMTESKAGSKSAADAADSAATTAQAVSDHTATTSVLLAKGIERDKFEKAIAIGEAKARSDMMGLTDHARIVGASSADPTIPAPLHG